VEIAGFVEVREERERSDRIVVRALKVVGERLDETPERVRLSVRRGTAPPVGSYVALKDGQSLGVRGADGRLRILRTASDNFAAREWLAADGDARAPKDAGLREGFTCDQTGCIGRLADGALVALVRAPSAVEEDCRRAALVVSQRTAPPACAAHVIDRAKLRANGAVALVRSGDHWTVKVARPAGSERPWARLARQAETAALPETFMLPVAGDAMPRRDDIEPGD